MLLDMLEGGDGFTWKRELMEQEGGAVSPVDLLEQRFSGKTLPAPQPIPDDVKTLTAAGIERMKSAVIQYMEH